jgi:fucose 4-O-acetylase-like acetyltransferase
MTLIEKGEKAIVKIQDRVAWIDALSFWDIIAIWIGHLGENTGRLYSFVWTYHVLA